MLILKKIWPGGADSLIGDKNQELQCLTVVVGWLQSMIIMTLFSFLFLCSETAKSSMLSSLFFYDGRVQLRFEWKLLSSIAAALKDSYSVIYEKLFLLSRYSEYFFLGLLARLSFDLSLDRKSRVLIIRFFIV